MNIRGISSFKPAHPSDTPSRCMNVWPCCELQYCDLRKSSAGFHPCNQPATLASVKAKAPVHCAMAAKQTTADAAAPAAGPRLTVASKELARSRSEVMTQMWREG